MFGTIGVAPREAGPHHGRHTRRRPRPYFAWPRLRTHLPTAGFFDSYPPRGGQCRRRRKPTERRCGKRPTARAQAALDTAIENIKLALEDTPERPPATPRRISKGPSRSSELPRKVWANRPDRLPEIPAIDPHARTLSISVGGSGRNNAGVRLMLSPTDRPAGFRFNTS